MQSLRLILMLLLMVAIRQEGIAQNTELLIFNASGNASLKRNKTTMHHFVAEKVLPGDIVTLNGGSMTLITRQEKRVTLSRKGSYSYGDISALMEKTATSTSVRYFIMVWESMKEQPKQTNAPGGVVRGDEPFRLPVDSAVILSDSIRFFFRNPTHQPCLFRVLNHKFSVLVSDTLTDSVRTLPVSALGAQPIGKFYWEISSPFTPPVRWCFIIPDPATKARLLDAYFQFQSEIRDLPESDIKEVSYVYMKTQKIYVPLP